MAYPSSLPVFSSDSYSYTDVDEMSSASMEAGPDRRRRTTRGTDTVFTVYAVMTSEQLDLFEEWYASEAAHGTAWVTINLIVGIGSVPHLARFVGHYSVYHGGHRAWVVSAILETRSRVVLDADGIDAAQSADLRIMYAVIDETSEHLTVFYNRPASIGPGYSDSDFTIDVAGGLSGIPIQYISGSGTAAHLFSIASLILKDADALLNFSGGSTSVLRGDLVLAPVAAKPIINNSQVQYVAPDILSASIGATGTPLSVIFNQPMTRGAGYSDLSFTLYGSESGVDIGVSYQSGDGTDTWEFSISTVMVPGEYIELYHDQITDGVENSSGDDLPTIEAFVVDNLMEDFSDIVFWSGFDGTLSEYGYTGTAGDYPANLTADLSSNGPIFSMDTTDPPAGSKSLQLVSEASAQTAMLTFQAAAGVGAAGRVGFWYRYDYSMTPATMLVLMNQTSYPYPHLLVLISDSYGLLEIKNGTYVGGNYVYDPSTGSAQCETTDNAAWDSLYHYYEFAWDINDFGLKVYRDGVLLGTFAGWGAAFTKTMNKLLVGQLGVSTYRTSFHMDNLIVSSNPDRDLYALADRDAYPAPAV